ncbi:MAG: hypothetical protein ABIB79_00875 [archaeon]
MKISDIIIIILTVLSIATALWYLFGNSPTFEQAILIFILTLLFTIGFKVSQASVELGYILRKLNKLESSFINLSKDFKKHIKKEKH